MPLTEMESKMFIRKAMSEDLESIVQLIADDKLGSTREDFQVPLPDSYRNAFSKIQQDSNQELVVLDDGEGRVIGTLQLSFLQYLTYKGGIRAQIEAVRIHKEFRGRGLGEVLFKWAINRSQQKGAHVVQLTTDKKRPDAKSFYEKLGFVASHEGMKLHL